MSIRVEWGDEQQTLILITFEGPWTWEDFDASVDTGRKMAKAVGRTVDVIVDVRAHPNPPSPNALSHFQKAWRDDISHYGRFVIVGGVPFMRRLVEVVFKVLDRSALTHFAGTIEEAKALIHEQRARQSSR